MEVHKGQFALISREPITLLVVDDHALVRRGVAAILSGSEIHVVGEAETVNQAIEQAKLLQPHVVLLDVRLREADGLAALPAIREQAQLTKFIVFTAHENQSYLARAVMEGASGYLLKGATKDEILEAIRHAHVGLPLQAGSLASPEVGSAIRRWPTYREELPLTQCEAQVLQHVALGMSNREIGRSLDISADMVSVHIRSAMRKVDADDRTAAAVWAVTNGLL